MQQGLQRARLPRRRVLAGDEDAGEFGRELPGDVRRAVAGAERLAGAAGAQRPAPSAAPALGGPAPSTIPNSTVPVNGTLPPQASGAAAAAGCAALAAAAAAIAALAATVV